MTQPKPDAEYVVTVVKMVAIKVDSHAEAVEICQDAIQNQDCGCAFIENADGIITDSFEADTDEVIH